MERPFFIVLMWTIKFKIFENLTLEEFARFGACCKTTNVMFKREIAYRKYLSSCSRQLRCRFLSRKVNCTVALTSYPRSGNSRLRQIIEDKTGIYTGSDNIPSRKLSSDLIRCGFIGEGVADDSVCVIKSHFPERLGYLQIRASKVVLLVRNPYDSILSYFHMAFTNTHDQSLSEEAFYSLRGIWDNFVANEVKVWKAYHRYWIHQSCTSMMTSGVPMLVLRYEDLLHHTEALTDQVIKFLPFPAQGSADIDSPSSGSSVTSGYTPRQGGGRIGKALGYMSTEQVKLVAKECAVLMRLFGYQLVPPNVETSCQPTGQASTQPTDLPSDQPSSQQCENDVPMESAVNETAETISRSSAAAVSVSHGYTLKVLSMEQFQLSPVHVDTPAKSSTTSSTKNSNGAQNVCTSTVVGNRSSNRASLTPVSSKHPIIPPSSQSSGIKHVVLNSLKVTSPKTSVTQACTADQRGCILCSPVSKRPEKGTVVTGKMNTTMPTLRCECRWVCGANGIRAGNDSYGRAVCDLRKPMTNNDTTPLPIKMR